MVLLDFLLFLVINNVRGEMDKYEGSYLLASSIFDDIREGSSWYIFL